MIGFNFPDVKVFVNLSKKYFFFLFQIERKLHININRTLPLHLYLKKKKNNLIQFIFELQDG